METKYFLFFFIILSCHSKITLNNQTKHFNDKYGRSLIFHGVNVVSKIPPYIPSQDNFDPFFSLNDLDIKYLTDWGFNIIRLGVIWEAVEKSPGHYDEDYLTQIENLIKKLGNKGIYVIVDAHQDLFSRTLCGEGVPYFYANQLEVDSECSETLMKKLFWKLGLCLRMKDLKLKNDTSKFFNVESNSEDLKRDENNLPLISECKKRSFIEMHLISDVSSIYTQFYSNTNGILDKFIDFWKFLLKRLVSLENIIAFDLWNEPWTGDMFNSISSLIPHSADRNYVFPFYKKVDDELRSMYPDYKMIFSPSTLDNLPYFGGFYFNGFTETPGGKDHLNHQIMTEHIYCVQSDINFGMIPNLHPSHVSRKCRRFIDYKARKFRDHSYQLGVIPFIGEFGACRNDLNCYYEVSSVANALDENLISWTFWQYKSFGDHTTHCDNDEGLFNDDGSLQQHKINALVRPYVMKFQGVPLKSAFTPQTKILNVRYRVNLNIPKPTVIYLNKELNYQKGFKLFVFPVITGQKKGNLDRNFIQILKKVKNNEIKILITEKSKDILKNEKIDIVMILSPKIEYQQKFFHKKILFNPLAKLTNQFVSKVFISDIEDSMSFGNIIVIDSHYGLINHEPFNFYVVVKPKSQNSKSKAISCKIRENCLVNDNFVQNMSVKVIYRDYKTKRKIKVFKMAFKNALKNHISIFIN